MARGGFTRSTNISASQITRKGGKSDSRRFGSKKSGSKSSGSKGG